MIAASVVVCAHKPDAPELLSVLAALQAQSLPTSDWELVLVENRKGQNTKSHDLAWHLQSRILVEDGRNSAPPLRRAFAECKSGLLIVLDENAEPASDYLSEAVQIGRQWPRLGAWGSGAIDLEFEGHPSQLLRDLASQLARRNVDAPRYSNVLTCVEAAPPGPGLCIRADVAAAYCESPARMIPGESDEALSLDLAAAELSSIACTMGLGMGIFPQLKLKRFIPGSIAERQFLDYSERQSILHTLHNLEWKDIRPADPLSPAALVSAARSILLESGIRRRLQIAEFKASIKARKIIQEANRGYSP
jgi:hypothetical protein